jgi:hypothetical protein
MLVGRSQLNENLQGDFSIIQQISALRRENRFLKVGLFFCLVLSTLPYLTGFQPETISAKRVVTEKIEFVRDGKTVMSISLHPIEDGLFILGRDKLSVIGIMRDKDGGLIVTYNKDGKPVASMGAFPEGGSVGVCNNDGKPVAAMGVFPEGGSVGVCNNDGKPVVAIGVLRKNGRIEVLNNDGKLVWAVP